MRRSINIPLTLDEYAALRDMALAECREPREQARYLVRLGLGLAAPASAPVMQEDVDSRRAALAGAVGVS